MSLSQEQDGKLCEILDLAYDNGERMNGWEKQFISDLRERYEREGSEIFISPKMWGVLNALEEKLAR